MKISENLFILKTESVFKKTPCGRPLTDYAVDVINATLSDEKNYNSEVVQCLNCCIIVSSLLVPEGCVNCGSKDLSTNIDQHNVN